MQLYGKFECLTLKHTLIWVGNIVTSAQPMVNLVTFWVMAYFDMKNKV